MHSKTQRQTLKLDPRVDPHAFVYVHQNLTLIWLKTNTQ